MSYKTVKVRIENDKCKEKYLYISLPINKEELLDLTSDVIGRDIDGYLLDMGYRTFITRTGEEIEDIYELNEQLIKENNIDMPKYMYGENPYVFKENGRAFKGTFNSRLMPLLEDERYKKDDDIDINIVEENIKMETVLGVLTDEYALDIYRSDTGYLIKEYKMNVSKADPKGAFYYMREKQLKDKASVVEYISDYKLGPSCFINQIVIYTKNTQQEKELMDDLLKLKTHRRMNIRNFIFDTNE